jgi:hypothetical protein
MQEIRTANKSFIRVKNRLEFLSMKAVGFTTVFMSFGEKWLEASKYKGLISINVEACRNGLKSRFK